MATKEDNDLCYHIYDMASEIFVAQESSRSIESSSSGTIMDHGIKAPSALCVLWLSHQDVQVNVTVLLMLFAVSDENIMCGKFIHVYVMCMLFLKKKK